jgi:hypothetical protein
LGVSCANGSGWSAAHRLSGPNPRYLEAAFPVRRAVPAPGGVSPRFSRSCRERPRSNRSLSRSRIAWQLSCVPGAQVSAADAGRDQRGAQQPGRGRDSRPWCQAAGQQRLQRGQHRQSALRPDAKAAVTPSGRVTWQGVAQEGPPGSRPHGLAGQGEDDLLRGAELGNVVAVALKIGGQEPGRPPAKIA